MHDTERGFQPGYVTYTVGNTFDWETLHLSEWKGYLAFSNHEVRIGETVRAVSVIDVMGRQYRKGELEAVPDAEGYLMEVNLWKSGGDLDEEVVIEREDAGFLVQSWRLFRREKPPGQEGGFDCHWREVEGRRRHNKTEVFDTAIKVVEVIVPERRLHFFITTER